MANKLIAALLALFLGGFGIHKFYLHRPIQGIIYLLLCWTWIPSLIAFIEGIVYLCMSQLRTTLKMSWLARLSSLRELHQTIGLLTNPVNQVQSTIYW